MGNSGASNGADTEALQGDPERAWVDAHGNIRQPVRDRSTELSIRSGGGSGSYMQGPISQRQGTGDAWWTMQMCFPSFRWNTILGALIGLQIFMYFVSCWAVTPRGIVEPSNQALWKLGSSNWIAERCVTEVGGKFLVELRRLVIPVFLHGGLLHILMNLSFQFMSGPGALELYGPLRFCVLFLGAGVCGNLLSDAFETNGVGASTSLYGLIGADIAQVWLVWHLPGREEWRQQVRQSLLMRLGFLVFWEVLNWKTIDHYGHLGGFLSGFSIAVLFSSPHPEDHQPGSSDKKKRMCGGSLAFGVGACVVKIFFWRLHDTANINGHIFPWSSVCWDVWNMYSV
eukprot:TRINITY_DN29540_c0_g2_i1.p1 TRINITY_DN29540_c0_g2~~TRINITY_DN29540_c0_g2_i1.p1  ORF type:complete len:342 (-),score=40.83 TRINITY_DN29540_c0_g2_i1:189-1214(-)